MVLRCAIKKRERNLYIGECLELGVVTQGKTIKDCRRNLLEALEAYIEAAREAKAEYIIFRPVPFYSVRKIIFDICYQLGSLREKGLYFKDERFVPVGI